MFIIITNILDINENIEETIPKTLASLNKNKIFFTEIKANNDYINGKVVIRHITMEEFKKEFKLETKTIIREYIQISRKIEKLLK